MPGKMGGSSPYPVCGNLAKMRNQHSSSDGDVRIPDSTCAPRQGRWGFKVVAPIRGICGGGDDGQESPASSVARAGRPGRARDVGS